MSLRRGHHLPLAVALTVAITLLPAVANSEVINPEVKAVYPQWLPEQEAVKPGKTVKFVNANGILHGVHWTGGPKQPSCPGVPIDSSSSSWSGSCTFTQEGTYTFECTVHPVMKGTIYVNATGTIPPPPPTATTEAATSVTATGATLKGMVNPNGQATEYLFKYGTTTGYGTETSPQPAGTGTTNVPASAPVTGLASGTTYHFELVATYASGSSTVLGGDRTFTTASPPGAPTATTESASSVTETGATLKGTVNPNGQATEYFFKYGTTTGYGTETSPQPAGTGTTNVPASAPVTGLASGTIYHFELVAHNASGTAPGADHTFTTTSPPPPSKEPPSEPPPTGTTTTTTPLVTSPSPNMEVILAPLVEGSVKLAAPRHFFSVHGSLDVSQTGAGGRLEVDLLAKSASLAAARRSAPVRVGRFVRASVSAGKASFSVALNARGKSALRRHHRLAITVKITLTPTQGAAVTVNRSVVLRA